VILEYRGKYKALTGEVEDTTANRCIIAGFIEAVNHIKKPCKIIFVSSTSIGVSTFIKSGKGTNSDILKELILIIRSKNCDEDFIVLDGEGARLNEFIHSKFCI
jgi:hypothetical protein